VKVLSSPKISVLNNQTALLKVVDNNVFFSIKVTPAILNANGVPTTPATYESHLETVPVGFVMSVTPQISDTDEVTLNVRPTITRVVGKVKDPNPALATANVTSEVPVIQARELESIMKVNSGQIAVMGGLMQDSVDNAKDSVPVLGRIPVLGDLFSYRNENTTKTELVIFMRPVVVKDASINGDYKDYRYILPGQTPDTEPYPFLPRRTDHESSNASAQESRARQTKRADDELDKPSEAFDEILALTPEPAQPATAPAPKREFNLDALSLEPMAGDAPAPPVAPAASRAVAEPAACRQRPQGAGHDARLRARSIRPGQRAAPRLPPAWQRPRCAPPPAPARRRPVPAPAPSAPAAAPPRATAAHRRSRSQAGCSGRAKPAPAASLPPPSGGDKPRAAARARARAAATAEPTGIDPERLRLIGLIAVLVLLVGGFGLYYWRALAAPAPAPTCRRCRCRRPAPPAPRRPVVVAALGPGAAPPAAPADSDDPMLAPTGINRAAQQALERRIAKTEEELAAARGHPGPAAAPAHRTTAAAGRATTATSASQHAMSPVAPALDGAYNAFNSGDLQPPSSNTTTR
jgi:hypothetical protein